nr:MAG TPA: hypothetical protein [Caudoviricetes sp.]
MPNGDWSFLRLNLKRCINMDLKQYRLNDWEWYNRYKDKYGLESFTKYKDKIFDMLANLKSGRLYDLSNVETSGSKIFIITYNIDGIEKQESNPDLFIKLCCMFILSFSDYEFSENFDKIMRK